MNTLLAMIDLNGEICQLNHGLWMCPDPHAVDYLTIPCGRLNQSGPIIEADTELQIPVCRDCAETISEINNSSCDWILYFCLQCGSSAWRLKRLLKYGFNGILMTMGCHNCSDRSFGSWVKWQS